MGESRAVMTEGRRCGAMAMPDAPEDCVAAARRYPYRVFWSEPDGECVAVCDAWPGMSSIEATPEEALAGAVDLVADVLRGMAEAGVAWPEPRVWRIDDPLYAPPA